MKVSIVLLHDPNSSDSVQVYGIYSSEELATKAAQAVKLDADQQIEVTNPVEITEPVPVYCPTCSWTGDLVETDTDTDDVSRCPKCGDAAQRKSDLG